jgi:hypothetical protein
MRDKDIQAQAASRVSEAGAGAIQTAPTAVNEAIDSYF